MMRIFATLFLLFLQSGATAAEPLGRLFFSPQQRESMDRGRRGEVPGSDQRATLNGYIQRSDGKGTVWIDRIPYSATQQQVDRTAQTTLGSSSAEGVSISSDGLNSILPKKEEASKKKRMPGSKKN